MKSKKRILVSSCLIGKNVRWNGANKRNQALLDWLKSQDFEIATVCPEHELFGTPRPTIRLVQIEDNLKAEMTDIDVMQDLDQKCKDILSRHPTAVGFIGVLNSPTCGISVGAKGLGKKTKGSMHKVAKIPTADYNQLRNERNKEAFLRRIERHRNVNFNPH